MKVNNGLRIGGTCGWAMASSKVLATDIGRSKVAQPPEYTITSSNGERKPRFLADNVEHTKSNTHMSVQIPTTKIFFISQEENKSNFTFL